LEEAGYVEGRKVRIEYRWAEGQYDRLPTLAADLVRRQVSAIVAPVSTPAALAAKAATMSIPVVFSIGGDPVELGLVASLNRPVGNITGVTWRSTELIAKGLELIVELVPTSTRIAALVNPGNPNSEIQLRDLHAAARRFGRKVDVLNAGAERDLLQEAFPDRNRLGVLWDIQSADQFSAAEREAQARRLMLRSLKLENPPYDFAAAFRSLAQDEVQMLLVLSSPLFSPQNAQIARLAVEHRLPAMFILKSYVEAGGLMSYGVDFTPLMRRAASFVAKVLRGAKPADLPVEQATHFEFVLNLKTAKAMGITLPTSTLLRADEVIE
jgi:putative tryptophan/tyrosine transport system substrate-binding protein